MVKLILFLGNNPDILKLSYDEVFELKLFCKWMIKNCKMNKYNKGFINNLKEVFLL